MREVLTDLHRKMDEIITRQERTLTLVQQVIKGLVLELEIWRDRSVATSGIAWRPLGISFLFEVIA